MTWTESAWAVIHRLRGRASPFTADDIWDEMEAFPPEPRRLGVIVHAARRQGLIHPTGAWVPSRRLVCHHRPVREWRSA